MTTFADIKKYSRLSGRACICPGVPSLSWAIQSFTLLGCSTLCILCWAPSSGPRLAGWVVMAISVYVEILPSHCGHQAQPPHPHIIHYMSHYSNQRVITLKDKRSKKSCLCALKWNQLIMSNGHNFLQLGVKVLDNLELTEINIYLSSRCLGRAESRSSPLGHPGTRQCL